MPRRIQARSSSSRASLRQEVQDEKKIDTKSCQIELVESSLVGAIDSRSIIHTAIEDPQESTSLSSSLSSSSSSPSVVTSECSREVESVDTLDSESNPSVDDSATDDQEDAANGNRDPVEINQAVDSCIDPTSSTSTPSPSVCSKSKLSVRDMVIEMIDAQ